MIQPGDRVALVFRRDEAARFTIAFYGCIFAAIIPVAIEPPVTREVREMVGYVIIQSRNGYSWYM